jgi:hypothetical protein
MKHNILIALLGLIAFAQALLAQEYPVAQAGNNVNNSPVYGLGLSNVTHLSETGTQPAVQLSGHYGILFRTASGTMNFYQHGGLALSNFIDARQYITVSKGSSYRVALNGQGDGYITGRNDAVQDKFLISSNGASWFNGGNVGIGTQNPAYTLDVVGNMRTSDFIAANQYIAVNKGSSYRVAMNGQGDGYITGRNDNLEDKFLIATNGNSYLNGGNVGIGTTNPTSKLTVNGTVHSKEVKVDLTVSGPDYVFEPAYALPSLDEVEQYVREKKHLPEIPTAKEMEQNGINLSEMNMLLLKKIEEMTLYLIEIKKEVKEQQKVIDAQQEEIQTLKKSLKKFR